jgi:pimeloyl-ACP methyl ester carboxylesterase
MPHAQSGNLRIYYESHGSGPTITTGPSLDEILKAKLRLFFLTGERDAVLKPATIRAAHQLIAGSVMTVVPGGPHSMYWEAPELFNMSVHLFLQQIYGGGA